jgi:predicted phospho-2-dehydro-3-deoxyheptonate aldolase
MCGKQIRLRRIMNPDTGKTFIVALDHGFTLGPIKGIENVVDFLDMLIAYDVIDAVIVHKGIVSQALSSFIKSRNLGLIIHLSGSTSLSIEPLKKRMVCSVESAMRLGCDAVSVHINVGDGLDGCMLEKLGKISDDCNKWGIPLLAMMYPRGSFSANGNKNANLCHAVRIAGEMGADIIKTDFPEDKEMVKKIIHCVNVPIIFAGGELKEGNDNELVSHIEFALSQGSAGVAIGRNVFQHTHPESIIKKIGSCIHMSRVLVNV